MSVHTDFQHDPLEKKARRRGKNSISTLEYENKACFECPCKKIYVLLKNECRNPPPLSTFITYLCYNHWNTGEKISHDLADKGLILIISSMEGLKMSWRTDIQHDPLKNKARRRV